jgi:CcmD family protein
MKIDCCSRARKLISILFLIMSWCGIAAAALPDGRDNEGFEPVSGDSLPRGESIPADRLVGAAYGFVFAAVLVYVVSLARRTRRVEDEVSELKRKLQARG